MNPKSVPNAILRAASLVAPAGQRAEWLVEWRSELWYVPARGAARFCLGAFRDAYWVRRNSHNLEDPATPEILRGSSDRVIRFGSNAAADLWPEDLRTTPEGIRMRIRFREEARLRPSLPAGAPSSARPALGLAESPEQQ